MISARHTLTTEISSPLIGVWQSVGFTLMLAITLAWALSAIGFLFGVPIRRYQAAYGVMIALTLMLRLNRSSRTRWLSVVTLTTILTGCLIVSAGTVDLTYDGWAYHQPGVIALSHGWNPVQQPVFGTWWASYSQSIGYPTNGPAIDALSTTAYPKALWILGAQAVVWGLPLDSGKYPALLLIFVSALTAFRALRLRRIPDSWCYPIATLTALNPICVSQSTTFYVDGALGSCLAIMIFSALSYDVTRGTRDLVTASCAALLACNLKFTGPIYTAAMLLPFVAWLLVKRRLEIRHTFICGISCLILLAASINPYFTNLRAFGSPVYPLNEHDVMEDQMSGGFLKEDRFTKLLISLTYSNLADRPSDNPMTDERNFTSLFQSRGIEEFKRVGSTPDLRIGGFGPFFGIITAASLLAAGLMIRKRTNGIGLAIIALGTLLSIIVNPQMWWARLVPQMWLLPVLVATAAIRYNRVKFLALIVVVVMGVTTLMAVISRSISSHAETTIFKRNLDRTRDAPLLVDVSASEERFLATLSYRLHEQGTTFELVADQCADPIDLLAIQGCRKESKSR